MRAWLARQELGVKAALLLAAITRLWFAAGDHSVFWPDEIYQSIEPAHRLAFGYGLLPWEFRDGARSWSFPALLALPLKLVALFHVHSGLWLVLAARAVMIVLALVGTAAGIEYARRLAGKSGALIAAFALALFPPLLVYSHRTLQEAASAPLVVLVPLLLLERGPRPATWAGVAVGIATLLRFQCAMLAVTFFVGLIFQQRWADLKAYTKAGAIVALAGGLLDWFTWGRPFHSFITYVEFNLIKSGASTFGVAPRAYFARTLWTSSGPAVLLMSAGLVVAGIRQARAAAAAVVVFVLLHSAIPHKEFRFILPVLPLMMSVGAAGIAELVDRYLRRPWAAGVVAGLVSLAFIKAARAERYSDLGQYLDSPRANGSVWDTEEEPNLLLADAGVEPDNCGVLMLGVRAAFTGGYSYLHRHVPLLYRFQACDEAKSANYLIAARDNTNIPPEFRLVRTRHGYGLYHRDGTCAPPPADFSGMLDGADDMGLGRAPIIQPDPHELKISAGSSAAAFVSGFGNGEHLECRLVRWAVGTSSRMAFPLEPTGTSYSLTFTAEPYYRSLPQTVRVTLNGRALADFELEEGWRGYQAIVPRDALIKGRNVVDFRFAQARRADGNDRRLLAALFDQILLAPFETSIHLDAGTSEARAYLLDGFSGDERDGPRTFVWSDGQRSRVGVNLQEARDPLVFELLALAYLPVAPLKVAVSVNDRPAGTVTVTRDWARLSVVLPANLLKEGANSIDLTYAATAKPSEHEHGSIDQRDLAVMYDELAIEALPPSSRIQFGVPASHVFLGEGFGMDESLGGTNFVWSTGSASTLHFRAPAARPDGHAFRFLMQAYAGATPQNVTVVLNGKVIGVLHPKVERQALELPVPDDAFASGVNELTLRYSRTVRPKDVTPDSTDARELAVRLERFEIVEGGNMDDVAPQ